MSKTLLLLALACLPTSRSLASPPDDPPKRYEAAIAALDAFIAREVDHKKLPSLSIALVDDQAIVWSKGYGFIDVDKKVPASADTVYRVGSVSGLFTDIAVMQLVEQGKVDLDAPVKKYLPDFAPKGPDAGTITLRQLMAHRSGLAREPPVGGHFDPTSPSLEATVASLNSTELVYKPGSRPKYSNAAMAAVGLALEKVEGQPFESVVSRRVLEPLGMTRSGFALAPEWKRDLAIGTMWTYHGREFPAPTFGPGTGPADGMYSTANDLARFLEALFAQGNGAKGSVIRPTTLEAMGKVQFVEPGQKHGFGLGFSIDQFEGRRRLGHSGAIAGCATELSALPEEKLGVVVIAAKDSANGLTGRMARMALLQMLTTRGEKLAYPLDQLHTTPLAPGLAKRLAGHYRSAEDSFDLIELSERLWIEEAGGGERFELRGFDQKLLIDDILSFSPGSIITLGGDKVRHGSQLFDRAASGIPPAPPPRFDGLIGEYGRDHDVLYILEKEGRLHALIEWFFLYPLIEKSPDVYEFPDSGLYEGEKLVFRRDPSGKATEVNVGGVPFKRRRIDGEGGQTFRITPTRPVEQIRREIAGLKPPAEPSRKAPDLVDLAAVVPGIRLDIRYASTNNFLSVPLYTSARALMQRPAAESLARVQAKLKPMGYGLLIHDAYRPWRVTKLFWEATPEVNHVFVADPAKGSRHNRGCAVDLTLCELATGKPIEMVGGYDEFSDRSYPLYPGGTACQRWHRDLLRKVMEGEGFTVFEAEWWHFDFDTWRDYPILDIPFEDMPAPSPPR